MILSEFTGASQSLNGSLVVNPWNTEELATALHDAVTMSDELRAVNYAKLAKYVKKYTSAWWGESFVAVLSGSGSSGERRPINVRQGPIISVRGSMDNTFDSGGVDGLANMMRKFTQDRGRAQLPASLHRQKSAST